MYYTYAHKRKDNGKIFYIGMGTYRRMYAKNPRNREWQKIVKEQNGFDAIKLADWQTREEASSHETLLIQCFKDIDSKGLTNIFDKSYATTNNGANISKALKGIPKSPEHIAKVIEANKKCREAKIAAGIKITKASPSQETREKIAKAQIGKFVSQETKQRISVAVQKALSEGKMQNKPPCSIAHRLAISQSKTGDKHPFFGLRGKNLPNFRGWWITPEGEFDRLEDASIAIGLSETQLSHRCKGRKISGKFYLPKTGFSFKPHKKEV